MYPNKLLMRNDAKEGVRSFTVDWTTVVKAGWAELAGECGTSTSMLSSSSTGGVQQADWIWPQLSGLDSAISVGGLHSMMSPDLGGHHFNCDHIGVEWCYTCFPKSSLNVFRGESFYMCHSVHCWEGLFSHFLPGIMFEVIMLLSPCNFQKPENYNIKPLGYMSCMCQMA